MGSFKALSLAGLVAFGAIGSAAAADLLPPAPPVEAPIAAPVDFGGWYLRGDVGVAVNQVSGLRSSFAPGFIVDNPQFDRSSGLGDSAVVGIGVGYQINSWFRGDLTAEYRTQADYRAIQSYGPTFCPLLSGRCYDSYSGKIGSTVVLANGYVDLGTWSGITPFVGVGVGMANHRFSNLTDSAVQGGGFGFAPNSSTSNFAWAIHAGAGYSITEQLKLEMSYRYLDMGKITSASITCLNAAACGFEQQSMKLASHDFRLGFRYMLGGGPAPIMASAPVYSRPGPLVRKY